MTKRVRAKKNIFGISLTVIALTLIFHGISNAQENAYVNSLFEKLNNAYFEDIWCHTDRTVYASGDNIWIKARCTNSNFSKESVKSKVLYLELVDQNYHHVQGQKIELTNGLGDNRMNIPDSLRSGVYYLKAYTNWMKNFSPEFHFSKKIYVFNRFGRGTYSTNEKTLNAIKVEFHVEGDNLIDGFETKVGIGIFMGNTGIDKSVKVINENNVVLDTFQTVNGFGSFRIIPEYGKSYYVLINGEQEKYKLPEVKSGGISLKTENQYPEKIVVTVRKKAIHDINKQYYLTVHSKTRLLYNHIIKFDNNEAVINLNRDNFPLGILYISLFSDTEDLITERVICNANSDKIPVKLTTEKNKYDNREKVIINLQKEEALTGMNLNSVSLSVTRKYQDVITDSKSELPDDYMLHLKNSKYSIRKLNSVVSANKYIIEDKGISLTGSVRGKSNDIPLRNIDVFMSVPDTIPQIQYSVTDNTGRFYFLMKDYYDEQDVIVQHINKNDSLENKINIQLDESFYYKENQVIPESSAQMDIDKNIAGEIIARFNIMKSYTKEGQGYMNQEPAKQRNVKRFYGDPTLIVNTSDYIDLPNFQEISREILPLVRFRKNKKECTITIINQEINKTYSHPMLLIDGIPVNDYCTVSAMGSKEIKTIEVQNTERVYGDLKLDGVLSVFTYKGNFENTEILTGGIRQKYKTYTNKSIFTGKDYRDYDKTGSTEPDLRDLLIWVPEIKINSGETKHLEFYTSDEEGEYIICLEGISDKGEEFSIKKNIVVSH